MDRLDALKFPTVRGNHDRQLATLKRKEMGPSDRYAVDAITAEQRARLGLLPFRLHVAPDVIAVHAAPSGDSVYLVEEMENGRLVRGRPTAIAERLGGVEAKLVLCGHSHRARVVKLPQGPTILNPGSVGCPAYEDTTHVSESGSPDARYAVVELRDDGGFSFELMAVPYSHEEAARRAEANGRPEWAHGLRTGFMPQGE